MGEYLRKPPQKRLRHGHVVRRAQGKASPRDEVRKGAYGEREGGRACALASRSAREAAKVVVGEGLRKLPQRRLPHGHVVRRRRRVEHETGEARARATGAAAGRQQE